MSFFDIFKGKKEQDPPKVELGIMGLKAGGYVDYDLETYRVEKKSVYEEDSNRSFEWHLVGENNGKHLYLGYEKDDGREYWYITEKIPNRQLSEQTWDLFAKDDAPEHLCVDGINFYGDHSGASHFYPTENSIDKEELIYWDYEDRSGEDILTVEQWGEHDFELYKGRYINDTDLYNIIQG